MTYPQVVDRRSLDQQVCRRIRRALRTPSTRFDVAGWYEYTPARRSMHAAYRRKKLGWK